MTVGARHRTIVACRDRWFGGWRKQTNITRIRGLLYALTAPDQSNNPASLLATVLAEIGNGKRSGQPWQAGRSVGVLSCAVAAPPYVTRAQRKLILGMRALAVTIAYGKDGGSCTGKKLRLRDDAKR